MMADQATTDARVGEKGRARLAVTAIETLARIRSEARTVATDGERVALSGWPGWGPLAKAFAPTDQAWADMAERIQALLPAPDVQMGLKGTYMAFYTPRDLAAAMWEILRMFGYDGGPVAELGCGGGVFFGTAPDGVPLVGVERDPTAAAITQLLYPRARVINSGLEDTHLPSNFAAVLGNVPFGNVSVFDPQAPDEVTGSLHNYFIWRAVQALAPGGYAILLTSRFTMDAWSSDARDAIAEDADLVGAMRLPNGALGGGTEATADVVILRRKGGTKRQTHSQDWRKAVRSEWDASTTINQWWNDNPEMVLGTMKKGPTTQYGMGLIVEPHPGRNIAQWMRSCARQLVNQARDRNLMWVAPRRPEEFDAAAAGVISKEGWHEGAMRLAPDGGVLVVKDGRANPLPRPRAELLRLLHLRDAAVRLIEAEADHSRPDAAIEPLRADVRALYADYVKVHGALNRYTQRRSTRPCGVCEACQSELPGQLCASPGVDPETGQVVWRRTYPLMQGFRHDPDAPLVFALEVFEDDDDGDTDEDEGAMRARPAPILTSRQNLPPKRHTHTDDPAMALGWVLDRHGGQVDMAAVARLLGWSVSTDGLGEEAQRDLAGLLGDRVYLDPTRRVWVTAEEYLSGDVRAKLRAAQTAVKHDTQFERNVDALTVALPKWLGPEDITANLGTPWIGPADVATFIAEVIGYRADVKRVATGNQWEITAQGGLRNSVTASVQWGTPEKDAFELVQLALNGKTPTVYKRVPDRHNPGEFKVVPDKEKSALAAEKQQEIRARFDTWVWEDPTRSERLVKLYNERYNNLVPRRFDGAHITVDGMAPWFNPYNHQREFVARAAATMAALCGLPVGSGKTNIMAMTAIKLKQVGLVNRPMIVVPNHLIEQIDREIRQLFPAAKILTGSAKTIAANRMSFTARCATGDWDIVLVTHSAFNAMDVDPETQARYLDDLEAELYEGVVEGAGGQLEGRMVKQLAKKLDAMRAKINDLRHKVHPRDAGVRFEQLGVDYILIDEVHYYKNLAVPVRTEGFSVRPSKRATDLDMKLRYLAERNGDRPHASLFSGTPVSNTMLELYVCLHYTQRDRLKDLGIGSADAWAAAYVQFVTTVEVTVDGGDFQMRTRPQLFVNAPELRVLLSQSADIRTAEQLGLKRPKGEIHIVPIEPTDLTAWYSTELVSRAEDVRNRAVEPEQDNMLKICTDGRRMATDPALVGLVDDGEYKLHVAAQTIVSVWQRHPGKLQVAFLDLGTPKQVKAMGRDGTRETVTDHQSYGRLRRMLTDAGMDVGRIRFIHDAKDDSSKARLFRDCRKGKVDLVIGSTDKLGVGTNIQKLIVAMHHIDPPFRPADVEQRDGRGLRPGNIHKIVDIFRYVTKRTFDAYMWQMLTRKLGFISQMLSGNLDRTVEDVTGDDVLSFAAIKAAATDQPLLQEKAEVESLVKKLTMQQRGHRQTVARMRQDAPRFRDKARERQAQAEAWEAIAAAADGIDLDDDTVIEQIHNLMGRFRGYARPLQFGRLIIGWRSWHTQGEDPELQPLLTIDGGAGYVEEHGYKFWKTGEIRRRLTKILAGAAEAAALLRTDQQTLLSEAAKADELAEKPFEHTAALNEAKARLERVEMELHQAATANTGPDTAAGDVVLDAEPDTEQDDAGEVDLGMLTSFSSRVMSDLEAEVARGLADLLGGNFMASSQ